MEEAIAKYGTPEIFNTDQGSQFTSADFTKVLSDHAIKISMDGKGRWVDNVFVERLWRSVKYEHIYLHAYESVAEARAQLAAYFEFYSAQRAFRTRRANARCGILRINGTKAGRMSYLELSTMPLAYGLEGPSASSPVDNS